MQVLIHACCAPCLTFPLGELKDTDTLVLFYNPNIQPYTEYELRKDCLQQYCSSQNVRFVEGTFDMDRFFQEVVFREHARCSMCYSLRLTEAAKYAKKGYFDFFTTTLLVSPYQKHDLLREMGQMVSEKYGVKFLYRDFRKGWKESISISHKLGLYRQKYCGCVYSERERFDKSYKHEEGRNGNGRTER